MTERMTPTEAAMWTVEKDPSLRSDFLNVTFLDRAPDRDRLMQKVALAIEALPRLRQRVVNPPLRLAPPEWVDDPQFDIDYHVRWVGVPSPGTTRQLLDLAATLSAIPFDRARPLWEFTVIEGLENGRAALLQKVHHTITDGVGGVKLSLALLDLEPEPQPLPPADATGGNAAAGNAAAIDAPPDGGAPTRATPVDVLMSAVIDAARMQATTARQAAGAVGGVLRHPADAPAVLVRSASVARSAVGQLFVSGGALSPVMTGRSISRRFDIFSVPLDQAKAAAKALGGTVNDLFVTGVAGAIGTYHEQMGEPVDELRMAMPVNLREDADGVGGNRFAPARIVVPVQPKDPRERFTLIRERLRDVRSEPALGLTDWLAGFVGLLPTSVLVPIARAQARTVDFVTSNVRGAPFDLYLAGAHIEANHPMGPCTGCAVNVTTLSYLGSLDVGVHLDRAAVTDPDALLAALRESFAELLALAP